VTAAPWKNATTRRVVVTETGVYLYAIALDGGGGPDPGLTGVEGGPVRTVATAGLVAYIGTVPLNRFGEEALRRNLEDLVWLEETARAHHDVVDAVARGVPLAPVRLVTVYRDDAQVRALLEERCEEFTEVLATVAGRREWGVKAYVAPEDPPGPDPAAGTGSERKPGTAYLKRRRTSLHAREDAWRRASAHAERIDAALAEIAVASRRRPAQDPQLSGRTDWMVLNGAYLVDDERGAEFAAAVDGFRENGLDVRLTGPWAPYSFTITESEADTGGPT
jgi:hypothetical protein